MSLDAVLEVLTQYSVLRIQDVGLNHIRPNHERKELYTNCLQPVGLAKEYLWEDIKEAYERMGLSRKTRLYDDE